MTDYWKDAPDWAGWVAWDDFDGTACYYESRPFLGIGGERWMNGAGDYEPCEQHDDILRAGKLEQRPARERVPKVWSVWRHRNGSVYRVTGLANMDTLNQKNFPQIVICEGVVSGKVWRRTLSDWHRSMTEIEESEA